MGLSSKFANRIKPLTKDSFEKNDPKTRRPKPVAQTFKEEITIFAPRMDTNEVVRLVPFLDKHDYPLFGYKEHYINGASFVCLKTFGEPCVVCDYGSALWQRGAQKQAPKFWSKDKAFGPIVDRNKDGKKGVQVLRLSQANEDAIRALMTDPTANNAYVSLNDPESGFDIYFKKAKTGKKFDDGRDVIELGGFGKSQKASPLGANDAETDSYLEYIDARDMRDWFTSYTDEEMLRFAGIKEDEQQPEDDGEAPADTGADEPAGDAPAGGEPEAETKKELSPAERLAALKKQVKSQG